MDGLSLFSLHAMTFALHFMVADDRADHGEWIVLEEHVSSFSQLAFLQKVDHLWYGCVNRASHLAKWLFAFKASICFCYYMYDHLQSLHYDSITFVLFVISRFIEVVRLKNERGNCDIPKGRECSIWRCNLSSTGMYTICLRLKKRGCFCTVEYYGKKRQACFI